MANEMATLQRDGVSNRYLPMPAHLPDVDAAKSAWLTALREKGTVREASKTTNIHTWQAYRWREADEEFAAAWDTSMAEVKDTHVGHLVRIGAGDGMPAVVANIARLRNLDPAGWSPERQAQVQVKVVLQVGAVMQAIDAAGLTPRLRATVVEGETRELPAPAPDPSHNP